MAMQSPFFSKRDAAPTGLRPAGSNIGQHPPGLSASQAANSAPAATAPVAPVSAPVAVTVAREGGSKLTVGPNIKLKGVEITDCDTLVVEGLVEATMDSRVIQIAQSGAFKGSADIDVAEIHGAFDGNLTVRQKLVIHATGKVNGKIRYGKLVVEEGGQIVGDILCGDDSVAKLPGVAKIGLQAV